MVARREDVGATAPAVTEAIAKVKKADAKRKAKEEKKAEHGIIMLEHLPHGFYEEELRKYFQQFGKVLRVKLARSKKTGQSRGYAFVEFEFDEVAKIAAESMNNYLMFERLIKCKVLEPGTSANKIFRDSYIRANNYPTLKARNEAKRLQEIPLSVEESKELLGKRAKKLKKQNQKLEKLGISYKFAPKGFRASQPPKKTKKKESVENATETGTPEVAAKTSKVKIVKAKSVTAQKNAQKSPKTPEIKNVSTPVTNGTPTPKKSPVVVGSATPKKTKTPVGAPEGQIPQSAASKKSLRLPGSEGVSVRTDAEQGTPVSAPATPKSPKSKKNKRKSAEVTVSTPAEDASKATDAATPAISPKQLKKLQGQSPKASPQTPSKTASPALKSRKTPKPSAVETPSGKEGKLGKRKSGSLATETPKKSPKLEPSVTMAETLEQPLESEPVVSEAPKGKKGRKSLQLPKVSPKLLRSKMRQSESAITPLIQKQVSPKPEKTIAEEVTAEKTPKKPKFSPKLLRSRKNKPTEETDVPPISDSPKPVNTKGKKASETPKKAEKPKFSPKLLRSRTQRHSDDLSVGQKTPKQPLKGRKSMK